tara:strand:+ start:129 stop:344 length:216 start_codon:yes stop_codon:yes gene_type:complete
MNLNDNMSNKEIINYCENRLITNRKKIDKIVEKLNNEIKEYNKSLQYSNDADINIALKYSFDYLNEIKLNN